MSHHSFKLLFAWACLAPALLIGLDAAEARRAYTVDDMLRLEEIGKVRFDPSGEHLVFERYGPFDQQSDYGRAFVSGETRSKVYRIDLSSDLPPRLVFDQESADGYTLNGMSPDGEYLAYARISAEGLSKGIVELDSGRSHEFEFTPDNTDLIDARWIGRSGLAYSMLEPGDQPFSTAVRAERVDQLVERWRRVREGKVSTASAIGSGSFADFPGYDRTLVLADARDGSSRVLGPGKYSLTFASSDGEALAGLREDRLLPEAGKPLEHGANMMGIVRTLVIYNLAGSKSAIEPCKGCDILRSSLNWSPEGRYLAFVARELDQTWEHPSFWIFDRRSGRAVRQALNGLTLHRGRVGSLQINIPAAWLGERPVVLLGRPSATTDARADWYLLGGDRPTNLSAAFATQTPELAATTPEGIVLSDAGELWLVDASGKRRNLTQAIDEPVGLWRQPSPYGPQPHYDLQPVRTLAVESKATPSDQAKNLYFLDTRGDAIERVAFPSASAEPLDASTVTHRVAFLDRASGTTALLVRGPGNAVPRQIVEVNGFLRDVVGGTRVAIDHKGPGGDTRRSWMLLPPGHKKGEKLPTVVNVYPGASCPQTYNKWTLDQVHALNDQILAGRGYAVLHACVPVKYEEVPRDPMKGLAEEVLASADAAIAQGYADHDRLAVQGQSYGGYTTGALIGLTPRFKSAVALAGIFDLVSAYGQFDQRERLDVERKGLSLFAASLTETSQGGMGAPPWNDPQRYIRNSPLMHVEKVTTPILLIHGDLDYVSTTQSEEYFTALTRLGKDARFVRYFGEDHVLNSPANIRDMWRRIFEWYGETLGPPAKVDPGS